MIVLGITGGIGSGKSVVCKLLQMLGIPVYIADERSKVLVSSDETIKTNLTELVGEHLYKEGALDKKMLSEFIFGNKENREKVNKVIHPEVKKDLLGWIESHHGEPIVAVESAILFESGFDVLTDLKLLVFAPKEVRIERAMLRDNADYLHIEKRINAQMPDEQKALLCDFVIYNDNRRLLIPQVMKIYSSLYQNNN